MNKETGSFVFFGAKSGDFEAREQIEGGKLGDTLTHRVIFEMLVPLFGQMCLVLATIPRALMQTPCVFSQDYK